MNDLAASASRLTASRRGFLIGAAGAGFTLAFARSGLAVADPAAAIAGKAHKKRELTVVVHSPLKA